MRCGRIWIVFFYGLSLIIWGKVAKTTGKEQNGFGSGDKESRSNSKNLGEINGNLSLPNHKLQLSNQSTLETLHPKETDTRRILSTKRTLNTETIKDKETEKIGKAVGKQIVDQERPKNRVEADMSPKLTEQSDEASGEGISSGDFNIEAKSPIFSKYEQLIFHQGDQIQFHQNSDKQIKAIDMAFQPPTRPTGTATQRMQAQTQAATRPPRQPPKQAETRPSSPQVVKPRKQSTSAVTVLPHSIPTKVPDSIQNRPVHLTPTTWIPPAGKPEVY